MDMTELTSSVVVLLFMSSNQVMRMLCSAPDLAAAAGSHTGF